MSNPRKITSAAEAIEATLQAIKLYRRVLIQSNMEFPDGGIVSDQRTNTSALISKREQVIKRDPKNHV